MKLVSKEAEFRDKSLIMRCEYSSFIFISFFLAGPIKVDMSPSFLKFFNSRLFLGWVKMQIEGCLAGSIRGACNS